jgi:lauroyl/myristoyl acyltransferase
VGIRGLYLVAGAFYWCRAFFNEVFKKPAPLNIGLEWLQVDTSLRGRIRRRQRRYLNTLMRNFPDRMAEPAWRSWCRIEGVEYLQAAQAAGRPAVLAFFHFGPVFIIRQWVRAHGFPAASYHAGDSRARSKLVQLQDHVSPFPKVRTKFYLDELRAATKFVNGGNILLIAVDVSEGRRTTAEVGDGWSVKLNTGAARLAHGAGADLMLCSIANEGLWRYRVKISAPIPGEGLRTEADWAAANNRLLAQMLPDFKAYPDQLILPIAWSRK